ncbi:MAG: translocation/assembly module TamB domain-containing protein [Timaviella obliquedivisa GSE-PSE-MK23-08B]|jgi:translocation and assembly module TamB|nr:translocation/assembly module TamB domain-containing protein [Timaviella obliquedivisa GSE-PSE-MK23-08B]
MTNSPNSGHQPEKTPSRRRRFLIRAGLVTGGVVLVGAIAAALYVRQFIQERLAPLIAESLSDTLNRPVNVGGVERVSLVGLRLGASALPPLKNDADQVKVEAIEVGFNLLELLWSRDLHFDITLVRPDAFIDQDEDGQWFKTKITTNESNSWITPQLDEIRVQEGRLVLAAAKQLRNDETGEIEQRPVPVLTNVEVRNVNGSATLQDKNQRIRFNVTGNPQTGGEMRLRGDINQTTESRKLTVEGQGLLAPTVNVLVPLPVTFLTGRASGKLDITLGTEEDPLLLNGRVRFRDGAMKIGAVPNTFNRLNGTVLFQDQRITFQDAQGRYGEIPARVSGGLDTEKGYDISIQVPKVSASTLLRTFDLNSPFAVAGVFGGNVKVSGAIATPKLTGVATSLEPAKIDQVTFANADTRFTLTADALAFDSIRATPTNGGLVTGRGVVRFGDRQSIAFNFRGQDLAGDAIARAYGSAPTFTIGNVNTTAQISGTYDNIQTVAQWQAPQATYPARGTVRVRGDLVEFRDTAVLVAGGMVRGNGELRQGRWNAVVQASGIRLNQFSADLRGFLSGTGRLSGSLADSSLAAIKAEGNLRFSEGIALIDQPLDTAVTWLGDRLRVNSATAPGFSANGFVFAQVEGTPEITNLDLNVRLQGYPVAALPIPTPEQIALRGNADFSGRLTGALDAVNVAGNLRLNQAAVNQVAFESALDGTFQYRANQFTRLDVRGDTDRIAFDLDGTNRPKSFYVQQGDTIATGRGQGDRLLADLQNFPLSILSFSPAAAYGLGAIEGQLNGRFDINLANLENPTVLGEVAIARPALGYINADELTGSFRYSNGIAVLNQGELVRANSRYQLSGSFNAAATQFQGQVTTEQGRIEDILTAFQWFDLSDFNRGISPPTYASAADVQASEVGRPGDRFINQLRRFSEVVALRNQMIAARQDASIIPDLAQLEGGFSGNVNVGFSPQEGFALDFGIEGRDWTWEDYDISLVTAGGSFRDGVLSLRPSRIQSGDSRVAFQGQIGADQQNNGQLVAENIPADAVSDLLNLNVPVEGNLNLNVGLLGTIGNPTVSGELTLVNGKVNNSPVPDLGVLIGYNDARLTVFGKRSNPFTLVGDIPYKFPFMTVEPSSDQFALKVDVENEGIALLSLFTDQVAWKGGEGQVNLQVNGTLRTLANGAIDFRPTATGSARFRDARFSAAALPEEDITNVTGDVLFANDRIQVQAQGLFSEGTIAAQGVLPILSPLETTDPAINTPLLVDLSNIALQMEDLYDGGVDGQVIVTGTALAPIIGGEVGLSGGRVFIPDAAPVATVSAGDTGTISSPRLNNLELTLGDRLRVTRDPILNFYARGKLNINGFLDNLNAQGTVLLRGGQVNLFTTQFRLAQGYESKAVFEPNRGLDPILDVRLVTSVPEVVRFPVPDNSPFAAAEVRDTTINDFGEIQTVRVQASVTGPASEFSQNLRLTSSPSRTESEIVALVGGNFINSLGSGGDAPLAIVSVAGSAFLSDFQNLIANTIGLSDFRIFPTTVLSDNARSSTLEIAGEVGFDVTRNLSVSLLQILTVQEPTQFSVRYRLNDNILLRGTTNLEGDSRAVVEFETRF